MFFLFFFHQDHITETIQKHIIENQTPGIKGKLFIMAFFSFVGIYFNALIV